jgi:hypothetical protein
MMEGQMKCITSAYQRRVVGVELLILLRLMSVCSSHFVEMETTIGDDGDMG